MSDPGVKSRQDFMESLAIEAGELLKTKFRTELKSSFKKDQSLVTEADLASQELIVKRIKAKYPGETIIAEEAGLSQQTVDLLANDRVWIIDPLDGTSNFAAGLPLYCVSIGCAKVNEKRHLEPYEGVVFAPSLADLYYGMSFQHAVKNGRPIRSKKIENFDLAKAFLVTGFSYNVGAVLAGDLQRFGTIAHRCTNIRRLGAAALDLCLVAEGIFDCFWERGLQPWDAAAGAAIIEGSGGILRNYQGKYYSFFNEGIIAGSAESVDSLRKLL